MACGRLGTASIKGTRGSRDVSGPKPFRYRVKVPTAITLPSTDGESAKGHHHTLDLPWKGQQTPTICKDR